MWFTYALAAMLAWGGSDFFSKLGSKREDRFSHWKMVMFVGAVMGMHAIVQVAFFIDYKIEYFIEYLPISLLYIFAMVLGYVGLRYLQLSVSSPICNASGAIAMVLLLIFPGMDTRVSWLQGLALALVCAGVILLAVIEKMDSDRERKALGESPDKKYVKSAVAVLLPVMYALIDGTTSFLDGLFLNATSMSEDAVNTSFELTFLLCAFGAAFYLFVIKKQRMSLWDEKAKPIAAVCETVGQVAYVYAMADEAVLAAPMIGSYCAVSAVLAHIFLKERLTKRHYPVIAVIIAGIFVLGFYG